MSGENLSLTVFTEDLKLKQRDSTKRAKEVVGGPYICEHQIHDDGPGVAAAALLLLL